MRSTPALRLALIILSLLVSGCAWVALTPQAESVRIVSAEAAEGCEKLGTVRAYTRAKVGFVARSTETISAELATLARNNAAEMGADSVVAEGPPSVDGRQSFTAYRCR